MRACIRIDIDLSVLCSVVVALLLLLCLLCYLVSDYMGDKTSHQCNNRWGCIGGEAGLDTGRWSLEEDKV